MKRATLVIILLAMVSLLVDQVYAKDKTQLCPTGEVVIGIDHKGIIICNPSPWEPYTRDADRDGFDSVYFGGDDCDDYNRTVYPGAEEVCDDQIDNNCNNDLDCLDLDCANSSDCEVTCADNSDCDEADYCKKPVGACDSIGECDERPTICVDVWMPVCGANGLTYGNSCWASYDGVCVEYEGECEGS